MIRNINAKMRQHVEHVEFPKALSHDVMLCTYDGRFQSSCDSSKLHAMSCDAFPNVLDLFLPIFDYLFFKQFAALCWGFHKLSCDI